MRRYRKASLFVGAQKSNCSVKGYKTMNAETQKNTPEKTLGRPALGRGLSALFGEATTNQNDTPSATNNSNNKISRQLLPIHALQPGQFQPRKIFDADALAELASSLKQHGVLQPLLVRALANLPGKFEIIAGERRWRAAQKAQIHEVPVIIVDFDDSTAMEVALIENLQRQDLNAMEEARGYERLQNEFNYTQEQLGNKLGKSRSHVANLLRLLQLPELVQQMVENGQLTMGHARALLTAENPEALAQKIVSDNLSVRAVEKLAASLHGRAPKAGTGLTTISANNAIEKDPDTLALERDLSALLGVRVHIDITGQGGRLSLSYDNLEQLDSLLQKLSA
jgi:ParB family transcriptional regulator, chromosome partitioning protein